jgi:sporulation protein YlmC with PRC-barrel domain
MNVIRDVLDNQIVDRNQRKMGKVDGIVIELRDQEAPRLAYLEVGMPILARRLHPRLQGWVVALQSKWGAKQDQPFRIPFSKVRDVGIDVEVDVEAEETPALAYEQWVRENIIKRIPGGG